MDITTVPAHQLVHGLRDPVLLAAGPPAADGVVVVQVRGELDLHTVPELRELLHRLLAPGSAPQRRAPGPSAAGDGAAGSDAHRVRAVVVDLGEVTFVDSSALGLLVQGHRWARPGGRGFAVVATLEMIHTLFSVTGLAQVMPLHPDVASALRSLRPAAGDGTGPRYG